MKEIMLDVKKLYESCPNMRKLEYIKYKRDQAVEMRIKREIKLFTEKNNNSKNKDFN